MPILKEILMTKDELNEAVCDWLARRGLDLNIEEVDFSNYRGTPKNPIVVTAKILDEPVLPRPAIVRTEPEQPAQPDPTLSPAMAATIKALST